ncbi:MAG: hypothetical protein RL757_2157, partial [Bacteroidota bacterium]
MRNMFQIRFWSVLAFCLVAVGNIAAQYDDIYYDPSRDVRTTTTRTSPDYGTNVATTDGQSHDDGYEYYESDEDDDDFQYSRRLRRFHRAVPTYSYFDVYYVDPYYYDPYHWDNYSRPFAFSTQGGYWSRRHFHNRWNRNYWGNDFYGWNRYNYYYNNCYSFNYWNTPSWSYNNNWGYGGYNCYDPFYSNYYAPSYYGGGWGRSWGRNYYSTGWTSNSNWDRPFSNPKGVAYGPRTTGSGSLPTLPSGSVRGGGRPNTGGVTNNPRGNRIGVAEAGATRANAPNSGSGRTPRDVNPRGN